MVYTLFSLSCLESNYYINFLQDAEEKVRSLEDLLQGAEVTIPNRDNNYDNYDTMH